MPVNQRLLDIHLSTNGRLAVMLKLKGLDVRSEIKRRADRARRSKPPR